MSELILPRRRFLAGLGALIAAPAIVRASSLMPVRGWIEPEIISQQFYSAARLSGSVLTPEMICKEALRLLGQRLVENGVRVRKTLPFSEAVARKCVDFELKAQDRTSTLADYSDRVIAPAIYALAAAIPAGQITMDSLALPQGAMEAASGSDSNVKMRMLSDYCIGTDSIISRFDLQFRR